VSARRLRWSAHIGVILVAAIFARAGVPNTAAATPHHSSLPVASGSGVRSADAPLERELRELVAMPGGPPGVAVIVQRGAVRRFYRAGVRELGTRGAISAYDHMRLASTSKAFSGAVPLALVDHHMLSLCDTVAKLLPELPSAWGKVTLREALNHTSGLPDFTASKALQKFLVEHPHATPRPLFLLHFVASEPRTRTG
jgi:D-alanyl-D-alanine carboxypeptidase